jgi:hypothetical protein
MLYSPTGNAGNRNFPEPSVTLSSLNPLAGLSATRVTPGNTPPDESLTAPMISAPFVCALPLVTAHNNMANHIAAVWTNRREAPYRPEDKQENLLTNCIDFFLVRIAPGIGGLASRKVKDICVS